MYVTLDEAKEYLGVYFTEKDTEIQAAIDAAERHAAKFLGCELSTLVESDSGASPADLDGQLPENIKLALKLFVSDFFTNKTIVVTGTIVAENKTAERILHPYRANLGV